MNLQLGVKYVMRNAQICTIDAFDKGDEERFASFQGYFEKGKNRSLWRPDGISFVDTLFDIIAVAQDPKASATYLHDYSG